MLNVARVLRRSRVNGPGWRAAVWVQGCTLRCPGCFNPGMHAHQRRHLMAPLALAEALLAEDIEGISLLGGEPFEQAAACARLAEQVRARGLSVVTYSGYTWEHLRRAALPEVQALLAATDLLIAGPFLRHLANDGHAWHGSTNQQLVFLTDRYGPHVLGQAEDLPVVEVRADGGKLDWTGIPAAQDQAWLRQPFCESQRSPVQEVLGPVCRVRHPFPDQVMGAPVLSPSGEPPSMRSGVVASSCGKGRTPAGTGTSSPSATSRR